MIPYKSLLSKIKDISKRNKAFDNLTPEQQRREIAFDALNLILTGQIEASSGIYWNSSLKNIYATSAKEFQKILVGKLPENCRVCQRGAAMLSQIRLGNSVNPNDRRRENGCSENIKGFSYNDFVYMENEFEEDEYSLPYHPGTNQKLANNFCNVISNGNFNTDNETDYLTEWKIVIL